MKNTPIYQCVTTAADIEKYVHGYSVVAFDFETAPNEPYRKEDKAALAPAKAHIVGCSFSVEPGTGIYVPMAHKIGTNIDQPKFYGFLGRFLTDASITKVAHNIAFESMMAYAKGIVIQPPVYDTICAAQMTLKSAYDFRKLNECGLKHLAGELLDEPLPTFASVTDGKHFDELPAQDAETVRYGAADSDFALRLYHKFNDWFDKYLPKHRY
ncbi:MAG: bifunctional 3'-5' exonuclease/DNA polymerase, partial [Selenomonadaceae bacterium]|nr:bifunctional 3'-5' exonuclease/DNA polymerase [Selenomonadaceae bacterium]